VGKLEMSQYAYSKIENNDIKLDRGRIEYSSKIFDIESFDLISFDDNLVFLLFVRNQENFKLSTTTSLPYS